MSITRARKSERVQTQKERMSARSSPSAQHERCLFIYTDGASRNNPGESGIGVVIKNDRHETIKTLSVYLGHRTNNEAEYQALIYAMEAACAFSPEEAHFYLDSQLVVRQILGHYKVRHPGLIPLFMKAKTLYSRYKKASIQHIPREENWEADALANAALDCMARGKHTSTSTDIRKQETFL